MNNRQLGSTTGLAVLAVFALLAGTGLFLYKTVGVDAGFSLSSLRLPGMASAAPVAPPAAPAAESVTAAPEPAPAPTPSAPKSGSSVGRAISGVRGIVSGESKQAKEEAARWADLQTNLQTLRSQTELYRLQHNDNYPDFRAHPNWEQIVRETYPDGTFVDENTLPALEGARKMGPYMGSIPANPLNGATEVVAVDGELSAGDPVSPARAGKAGYAFSIADGKLYATDATGRRVADVERMIAGQKVAAPGGKEAHRRVLVQTLRGQIMLYKLQHQDQLPDFQRFPKWEQMLKKTESDGSITRKAPYGPYLVDAPVNPANGFSDVQVLDGPPQAGHKAGADIGWVVDTRSGRLWATDEQASVILE